MNNIKTAIEAIVDRRSAYVNADDYYRGSQREVFADARFGRLFNDAGRYTINFAKTVVDSVLDRLEIAAVKPAKKGALDTINKIWEQNELVIDANEVHRRALVYGDCYAIVWPDEEGEVQITYNSPLTTVLVYDPENPRRKDYAVKVWESGDLFGKTVTNLNLYYADRIEKYRRQGSLDTASGDANNWTLREVVENPFGEIPVFHFRTHRPYGTPEHAAAIAPQDAINKMVANHMVTIEYLGAPQRYAISNFGNEAVGPDQFTEDDTDRENDGAFHGEPGSIWFMQGVSQVGQFAAADHKSFTEPILAYAKWLASITQTPIHHFQNNGQFASGEALRTAEAPLVKKIKDRQLAFGSTWRDIFRFALRIEGIDTDVQIEWSSPESMDSGDAWTIAQTKAALGIPMLQILLDMGYDKELAERLAKEMEEAKAANVQAVDLSAGMNPTNAARKAQAELDAQNEEKD